VELLVFARHQLVDRSLGTHHPALLLEGSWPVGGSPGARWSLDGAIDSRFEWVDEQAAQWAERLAQVSLPAGDRPALPDAIPLAYLNALALRYYLAKLIRVVAYFSEVRRPGSGDRLTLVAARRRDEDYAEVLVEICRAAGADWRVKWTESGGRARDSFPPNGRWRRSAAWLAGMLKPPSGARASRRRAVLCGNPRLLDPVCRELLARGSRIWWLYDRFALKSWLRWRAAGVGQLVCNASLGRRNRLPAHLPERIECRGVNLAPPLARWLAERVRTRGPRQTRIVEEIDAYFRRVRPDVLVLDEDATPLARAAVAVARQSGTASFVVQHGAPCCRFGFAPLAADRILLWGRCSQRQLIRWGVPPQKTIVTGSPRHDHSVGKLTGGVPRVTLHRQQVPEDELTSPNGRKTTEPKGKHVLNRPPRVLLLATVPPRDDRPDAVTLNLNRRTYAEMLRMACAAVGRLAGARLIVKLHPRAPDDPIAKATLEGFPSLSSRVVRRGPLERWLREADCVLSCLSSAGVEAALTGVPVIGLLPSGSGDVLPHDEWGMVATARSEAQLDRLLSGVFAGTWRPAAGPVGDVFANLGRPAAERIAEVILATGFCDRWHGQARAPLPEQGAAVQLPHQQRDDITDPRCGSITAAPTA